MTAGSLDSVKGMTIFAHSSLIYLMVFYDVLDKFHLADLSFLAVTFFAFVKLYIDSATVNTECELASIDLLIQFVYKVENCMID